MTQVLTIPTPFADLGELTENFAQRVDEERLMLPHPEPMPEGEWVQFNVLLGDGEIALAGVGRVQGAFDNGEEHPAEYRFDVVLDSLQFEGMHEVMFERLLVARSTQMGDSPVTGEVSVEELEAHAAAEAAAAQPEGHAPAEQSAEADPADAGWEHDPADVGDVADAAAAEDWQDTPAPVSHVAEEDDGDSALEVSAFDAGTGEVDVGDLEEMRAAAPKRAAVRPPTAPYPTQPREPGTLPSPHSFNGVALTRASLPAAWSPEPALRPDAAQSSGLFDYGQGIPRPASPPRPELDASLRVQAAPRPGAPWPRRGTGQHVIVEAGETPSDEAAFEDLGDDEDALTAGDEQVEAPVGDPEREEW